MSFLRSLWSEAFGAGAKQRKAMAESHDNLLMMFADHDAEQMRKRLDAEKRGNGGGTKMMTDWDVTQLKEAMARDLAEIQGKVLCVAPEESPREVMRRKGALLASNATDALRGLELGDRTLDGADASLILLRLMAKGFRITRA